MSEYTDGVADLLLRRYPLYIMLYQRRAALQSEHVIAGAFAYAVAVVLLKDNLL